MEGPGGHLTRGFVYLNGRPLVEYANGTTYFVHTDHLGSTFVHTDHLGSTRLLTNYPTPTIAESDDYYPFGEFDSSGSTSALKFTGDERDTETTLDHTLFRKYSSSLGRWTSPDPAGFLAADASNPQSWNGYSYVADNPVAFTGPFGLTNCPQGKTCTDPDPTNPGTFWDGEDAFFGRLLLGAYGQISPFDFLQLAFTPTGWVNNPNCRNGDCLNPLLPVYGNWDLLSLINGGSSSSGRSTYIVNSDGRTCTPSVFDPSCKPPSCPAVFFNAAAGADLGLPPNLDEAAKGTAGVVAVNRIVSRGLVQPLSSSFVRKALLFGDIAADVLSLGPILIQEAVGLKAEVKAWRAGTCTTIWSHP